jgi:hypothetical protein
MKQESRRTGRMRLAPIYSGCTLLVSARHVFQLMYDHAMRFVHRAVHQLCARFGSSLSFTWGHALFWCSRFVELACVINGMRPPERMIMPSTSVYCFVR